MRDGWRQILLGDVLTEITRPVAVADLTVVRYAGVRWYTEGVYERESVPASAVKGVTLSTIRSGDIVYNRMWATKASFGVAHEDVDGCHVTNDFPCFEADPTRLIVAYIELLFTGAGFQAEAANRATGTTERRRLKQRDFLAIPFTIPPLAEQRRIVDLIAAVDEAIDAADAEAEAADRTMGTVIDASIERDASPTIALGEAVTIVRGGSPRPIAAFETDDENGYPWIKIGDIAADGKYVTTTATKIKPSGLNKTRVVNPGDFILSNSMSFGRPYIVRITGCIHDGWLALSDYGSTFDSEYLYFLLRSSDVQSQFNELAAGSGVRNLKKESVASVKVKAPSLKSQQEIVARAAAAAELRDAARAARDALRELRADLLTALLSGEHEIPSSYDRYLEEAAA